MSIAQYLATPLTLTDEDFVSPLVDSKGRLITSGQAALAADNSDAQAASSTADKQVVMARLQALNVGNVSFDRIRATGNDADSKPLASIGKLEVLNYNTDFNELSWDRHRNNTEPVGLALEEETIATRTGSDFVNYNGEALSVILKTTNLIGSTATYVLSLQWKFDGTNYFTTWAAASVNTNIVQLYHLGPGITDAGIATESKQIQLQRTLRWVLTVGGTANGSHNMDTEVYFGLGS